VKALTDKQPPYGTVVFDCDSTLSRIEGIEELAHECRAEVEALTQRAMDGELPLEDVYGARLELIQPRAQDVQRVAKLYGTQAMPHARELVAAAQALGKQVHVVSGGLLPAVLPFARELGISEREHVQAVDIHFDAEGAYDGFEEDSPLARAGGKIPILHDIASKAQAGPVVFIGDGMTDLEAGPESARFIAFGGVAARPAVFEKALVTCATPDLAALVPLLFTTAECDQLRASGSHNTLLEAAASHA
jgi:phosphoserine phosphatase